MVGIVDYGLGNITSVAGAVEKVGHTPLVVDRPDALADAAKLILPGVGAFPDGMANLRERDLVAPLTRRVLEDGIPILGICLGAQLMTQGSDEFGTTPGLQWVPAWVERLAPSDPTLRVPHVGWDDLKPVRESVLLEDLAPTPLMYYVHSYCIRSAAPALVLGECEYDQTFVAAFHQRNIYGTQFHPEKSQQDGLTLLRNFLEKA